MGVRIQIMRHIFGIYPLIVLFLLVLPERAGAAEPTGGEKLFSLRVKPLFAEKCAICHGDEPEKMKGEFDMRTRESMLKGGETFGREVLLPGKGEESFLYLTTTRTEEEYEMPPKEADQLSEEQRLWIRDWINEGAPWPTDKRVALIQEEFAEGERVVTSKALSEDWQKRRYESGKLWAYKPIKVEEVPAGQNPIDYFVSRKLASLGLAPAPTAAPRELVRRMSFGFTGLPPDPDRAARFTAEFIADAAQAVSGYAAELMDSPHYGEQFGRHWLDVARYADTAGFANDFARPNAWRYRDYVIRAFNEDKPYDRFVREQIAGDEMNGDDPESLIAAGFLRMGPWEQTGMSVFRVTRQQWLDDVTDSVGQTFLGHALQCAKCHDHKFDPIPTRDYYRMMAVFSTTQFTERPAAFLPQENKTNFRGATQWVKAKMAYYNRQRSALDARVKQQRKTDNKVVKTGNNGLDPGDEASLARINKNLSRHKWELDRTKPIAFSVHTGNTVTRKMVSAATPLPKDPWGVGELERDTILTGGDAFTRGDTVVPGPLSAAANLGKMGVPAFPAAQGKRRLALAEWIVDEQNPLTARVMVNRIWSWHFGQGIAGNPNNFGGTGELPTHPALLDYLAHRFMESGWSIRKLNTLIASSETYRRSSRHPDPRALAELDPKSDFYAVALPRRLTAEEIRDSMLAVSGELVHQVGGVPARPDINMEVALQPRQIMGGAASVYEPDPLPAQRNRRSIYAEKHRGLRDPFLENFNQPGPDKSCELRDTSTVAPQALTLFNAEEMQDRSLAFAARLLEGGKDDTATIGWAFELALGRSATPTEMSACLALWKDATREEQGLTPEPKKYPKGVKRTVMAEKTGEPYDFWEHMPAYESYVPDLQRSDVDARTRGLAHVCLVIFNLNEFSYLD